MGRTSFDGDVSVGGRLSPKSFDCPVDAIGNAAIPSSAQIDEFKLKHKHYGKLSQPNTAATTETRTVHVARFAGKVADVVAGSIAACIGGATVVFDVKKNGTSILSSTITLDNANSARVIEVGTLNPALVDYAAGDYFEITCTATVGGGTLATGVYCQAVFNEGSQ